MQNGNYGMQDKTLAAGQSVQGGESYMRRNNNSYESDHQGTYRTVGAGGAVGTGGAGITGAERISGKSDGYGGGINGNEEEGKKKSKCKPLCLIPLILLGLLLLGLILFFALRGKGGSENEKVAANPNLDIDSYGAKNFQASYLATLG